MTPPKVLTCLYTGPPPSLVWAEGRIRSSFGQMSRYKREVIEVKDLRGAHQNRGYGWVELYVPF